ncbi:MAG: leucine-rich repeat-containing protein kinase family protein [Nodosilinea sp.]
METLDLLRTGQLVGTQRLNLSCGLTTFPTEIFDLAETLEILDLSNNHLTTLPDSFAHLRRLKIVFFNNNQFETVPEVLSQCPQLSMVGFKSNQIVTVPENALPTTTRWLILTDNRVESLPATLGNLSKLQKLMLAGNRLSALPDEMAACLNLELIRLSANQFRQLPPWLFRLPRLAWLAFAGNPLGAGMTQPSDPLLPIIDWADLTLGDLLGQGASGLIFRGQWHQGQTQTEVAVKLFKGEITSDGFPPDEMRAALAAGTHHHLVTPLGQVTNHPEQKNGLVFPLILPCYRVLGDPPSLESCTRDTYAPDTEFSIASVLQIARGMATAAVHLHRRGLMHGDLYPHNTLVSAAGDILLGDFGAASGYDPTDLALGEALERIEVRAFGCLLDDLLEHCPALTAPEHAATLARLHRLRQDCMQPTLALRPRLADIVNQLGGSPQGSAIK